MIIARSPGIVFVKVVIHGMVRIPSVKGAYKPFDSFPKANVERQKPRLFINMVPSPSNSSLSINIEPPPESTSLEAGTASSRPASIRESIRSGNLDPTTLQINPAVVGSSEPPKECPICLEPFDNPARAIPCLHEFDIECIFQWLEKVKHGTHCPLCRTNIIEIIHNSTSTGGPVSIMLQVIEKNHVFVPPLSSHELQVTRELNATRERRRLHEKEKMEIQVVKTWPRDMPKYSVKHKNHVATVSEKHSLKVKQEGLYTTSVLTVVLSIRFKGMIPDSETDSDAPEYRTDRKAKDAFQNAHARYEETMRKYANSNKLRKITACEDEVILYDVQNERGIDTILSKETKIEKRGFDEIQSACITWQARLVERGPANADDDLQILTAEIMTGSVRESHDKIYSCLAQFQGLLREDRQVQLERATTNLMEDHGEDATRRRSRQGRWRNAISLRRLMR